MRLVIVTQAALVLALASATPAAAISGAAGGVDASTAQYVAPSANSSVPTNETPGQVTVPGTAIPVGEETPGQGAVPVAGSAPQAQPSNVIPLADEDQLPFTGFLVLMVLGAGVLALTAGVSLRRVTAPQTH